jgi:RNA polymerase sigma factor (sigma-70 family)
VNGPAETQEDRQLLERILARDARAMTELYLRYGGWVGTFLTRINRLGQPVDEMIEDTFMLVWTQAREFPCEVRPWIWILGIAYRRGLASVSRHELNVGAERAIQTEGLRQALDVLPFEQRAALQLTYWLGLSCEETAAVMQCPADAIKRRMLDARRKLRALLPELGSAPPRKCARPFPNNPACRVPVPIV